ncbi:MAG: hypothetical protein JXR37_12000 [Kiritimatiellae bacterium]|nr:hypothetical protein [Kiritimatiellia bacterium]
MNRAIRAVRAILAVTLGLASAAPAAQKPDAAKPASAPARRDTTKSTAYLGPDRFWRLRDTLVFHLHDAMGTGFGLQIDLRDMNVYCQGPREAVVAVFAPDGAPVATHVFPDDGVVKGNPVCHDGVPDTYADLRYRAWHLHNSPGGYPPGKTRSPLLADPGRIPARTQLLRVPPAGKGLYRVMIVGCYDHWVSLTPDRPLAAGVHPGPAPLYMHNDIFREAYLYAPRNVKDIGLSVSEEVRPWGWGLVLEDEAGAEVARIAPRTLFNFCVLKNAKPDSVYRIRVTAGQPGANLHFGGAPMLLCPDAETARLLHGGVEFDAKGRMTFHAHQRVLLEWADSLSADDLKVDVRVGEPGRELPGWGRNEWRGLTLGDVAKVLALQDVDRNSARFGKFNKAEDEVFQKRFGFWSQQVDLLAHVAGWKHADNPYYGHAALVRRVALVRAVTSLQEQCSYFWYEPGDRPKAFAASPSDFWDLPYRSNWYPLQDAKHVTTLLPIRGFVSYALPAHVVAAWRQSFLGWTLNRTVMQQGECSNQWGKGLEHMVHMWQATREWDLHEVLERQLTRMLTPGSLGRVNPDLDAFAGRSGEGYGTAADSGRIGGGIMSDGFGHDAEYNLETESHLAEVWGQTRDPRLVEWANEYYLLKTHLTLPKGGGWPKNSFSDTVSPTDSNHRTRCYTHKTPLGGMRKHVTYGDIWAGEKNEQSPWPCLEKAPFVRVVDNRFFFVKTPGYYGILYGGPAVPSWVTFSKAVVGGGAVDFVGYGGMHYGGFGRKASKAGGISAVWVENCGPTLLCQNHNVWYSNVVWGRRKAPICEKWEEKAVDPTVVCSGYVTGDVTFDQARRLYTKTERLEYAPLTVKRTIQLEDDRILVQLDVTATGDLDLTELYECIPYYAQDRAFKRFGNDWDKPEDFKPSRALKTPASSLYSPPENAGILPDTPRVALRALDVSAKDGAAGACVILDKEYDCVQTSPVRYREVAAPVGAISLPLPHDLQKGQTHTVRYVLYCHQQAMTPEIVHKVAKQAGLL